MNSLFILIFVLLEMYLLGKFLARGFLGWRINRYIVLLDMAKPPSVWDFSHFVVPPAMSETTSYSLTNRVRCHTRISV